MDALEIKKANRFKFLNALYEFTNGDTNAVVNLRSIGEICGLSPNEAESAMLYLHNEHLAEHRTIGGGVGITHHGVVQVEQALAAPSRPTQYFPAVVNINVGTMVNSQIQQGTSESHQHQSIKQNDIQSLHEFLTELSTALPSLKLKSADSCEVDADIATLNAQAASPKPKRPIITESLKSLRRVLEEAAGHAVSSDLLPKLLALIESFRG